MKIHTLILGELETNCYIVADEKTNMAAVIDPAENGEYIFDTVKKHGYVLDKILLTHGHYDHIGGLETLRELSGAKVIGHKNNPEIAVDFNTNMSCISKNPAICVDAADILLDEGDTFSIGELLFTVIYTPGHTSDSVIYSCEDALFTGDTIFSEGYGRTDFYSGSFSDMRESLKRMLPQLSGKTIYPGHWISRKF